MTRPEMSNPGGRGAERAGVCKNQEVEDGSPGGSPSQSVSPSHKSSPSQKCSPNRTITGAEMSNPGGRGAERAGVCKNQEVEDGSPGGSPSQSVSPSHKSSPSQKCSPNRTITGAEMSNPGGRGADRAGVCQNQTNQDGSHGGSPSHKITDAEMPIPGGRGADRGGISKNQEVEDGSPGGSPSQIGSISHF